MLCVITLLQQVMLQSKSKSKSKSRVRVEYSREDIYKEIREVENGIIWKN